MTFQPPVARFIVKELGADVNELDGKNRSALHVAANAGCLDMVQCLIELGADINPAMLDDGLTPLDIAPSRGHMDVVRWLLGNVGVSSGVFVFTTASAITTAGAR